METRNKSIEEIFNAVKNECRRSITDNTLHSVKEHREVLAFLLKKAACEYGKNITHEFQEIHEKKSLALSFLFAQVTNAIFEKVFHYGGCRSQASYSLIELAKNNIFNASLIWSKTDNISTEHYYLLMLDDDALQWLKELQISDFVGFPVGGTGLPPESHFFDTWSDELSIYKNLNHDKNLCIKKIKSTNQIFYKPLGQLFKNEYEIIKAIIYCLDEYEMRLRQLPQVQKSAIPGDIVRLFNSIDVNFENEIHFLYDRDQCLAKLLSTIEGYKKDFQQQLDCLKNPIGNSSAEEIEQKDRKLSTITHRFFNEQLSWRKYSEDKLTGKYIGHQVRFFTNNITKENANDFVIHLNKDGFSAELKFAKGKPWIAVDLTTSIFKK